MDTNDYLKYLTASARFPKTSVVPVTLPKVQISHEEYNYLVNLAALAASNAEAAIGSIDSIISGGLMTVEQPIFRMSDDAFDALERTGRLNDGIYMTFEDESESETANSSVGEDGTLALSGVVSAAGELTLNAVISADGTLTI